MVPSAPRYTNYIASVISQVLSDVCIDFYKLAATQKYDEKIESVPRALWSHVLKAQVHLMIIVDCKLTGILT